MDKPENFKDFKITFAPGAFDDFEGTQEELDELVAEINRLITSGELFEEAEAIDLDVLAEEDPELAEKLARSFNDTVSPNRKLQ